MSEKGLKYDDDKLRYDLIPPEIPEELAKILTFGANKYAENNWQKVEPFNERYYSALIRHLEAWRKGERTDKESGFHHLSHALTNISFLLWKDLQNDSSENQLNEDSRVLIKDKKGGRYFKVFTSNPEQPIIWVSEINKATSFYLDTACELLCDLAKRDIEAEIYLIKKEEV